MKQRNPARRFSRAGLKSAGPPPSSRLDEAAQRIDQAHTLRQKALEKAVADGLVPRCDRCKKPMVRRINRVNGTAFFGCSSFPKCRETKPIRGRQG